jgi:hypothetical protein
MFKLVKNFKVTSLKWASSTLREFLPYCQWFKKAISAIQFPFQYVLYELLLQVLIVDKVWLALQSQPWFYTLYSPKLHLSSIPNLLSGLQPFTNTSLSLITKIRCFSPNDTIRMLRSMLICLSKLCTWVFSIWERSNW